jgi:hypothetical protein
MFFTLEMYATFNKGHRPDTISKGIALTPFLKKDKRRIAPTPADL